MWVTPGASTASTCSSRGLAGPRLSNSRAPLPRKTGTTEISASSSSPAARYCRTAPAPPPSETSLPPAASLARWRAGPMPPVTKWKVEGGAALHLQGLAGVVGEHEDGLVVRRLLAPVARPGVRSPRARAAGEHVAAHHGRPDVLEPALHHRRAGVDLAALLAVQLAEGLEREEPLAQLHPADAERVLRALLGAGGEAVQRHHHVHPEPAVLKQVLKQCRLSRLDHVRQTQPARAALGPRSAVVCGHPTDPEEGPPCRTTSPTWPSPTRAGCASSGPTGTCRCCATSAPASRRNARWPACAWRPACT